MLVWLLAAVLAASAPAPVSGAEPAVPTEVAVLDLPQDEVMAVPPALRTQMQAYVLPGQPSPTTRLQRLVQFMFDPRGLGIEYDEDATYPVAQAYATRRANCLAFTMLFLALAREAGLDAYPQEIGETLEWRVSGGTLFRDNHVNAGVRISGHRYQVDVAGSGVFGLQPPTEVSDQRLLAHYYNNLAVGRFGHGDMAQAQRYMATALQLDPGYAPHWSNAGVLSLHGGDPAAAERAYRKALALDADNASALFNMVDLAHRRGDSRSEAGFRQRLARVQQNDPLQHFVQALDYERLGDYAHAIEHYQRAIRLHRGEHRFYSALAHAYLLAGEPRKAARALRQAQYLSRGSVRADYRAQVEQLQAAARQRQ